MFDDMLYTFTFNCLRVCVVSSPTCMCTIQVVDTKLRLPFSPPVLTTPENFVEPVKFQQLILNYKLSLLLTVKILCIKI